MMIFDEAHREVAQGEELGQYNYSFYYKHVEAQRPKSLLCGLILSLCFLLLFVFYSIVYYVY
jgi:hypothetical protein